MDVFYKGNNTEESYLFKPIFKQKVAEIVEEMETSLPMNSGTYGTSFFDSIILQIKDSKQKVTVGQDSLDFGCLKAAT